MSCSDGGGERTKEFHDNWRVMPSRRKSGRANRDDGYSQCGEGKRERERERAERVVDIRLFGDVGIFGAKVTFGRQ